MEQYKTIKEIRGEKNKEDRDWFGVDACDRLSIETLVNRDVIFFDCKIVNVLNEDKMLVLFEFPEEPNKKHIFLSKSKVIMEDLPNDKRYMPFKAKITKEKNKTKSGYHITYG